MLYPGSRFPLYSANTSKHSYKGWRRLNAWGGSRRKCWTCCSSCGNGGVGQHSRSNANWKRMSLIDSSCGEYSYRITGALAQFSHSIDSNDAPGSFVGWMAERNFQSIYSWCMKFRIAMKLECIVQLSSFQHLAKSSCIGDAHTSEFVDNGIDSSSKIVFVQGCSGNSKDSDEFSFVLGEKSRVARQRERSCCSS